MMGVRRYLRSAAAGLALATFVACGALAGEPAAAHVDEVHQGGLDHLLFVGEPGSVSFNPNPHKET